MSWYNQTKMKCKDCGKEYFADISTFTIITKDYKICPDCRKTNGEVAKINNK